jgi:hypothetical protein
MEAGVAGAVIKDVVRAAGQRLGSLRGRVQGPAGQGFSLAPLTRLMTGMGTRLSALRSGTAPAASAVPATKVVGRQWSRPDMSSVPRKVALVVVVMGVALAAGKFVQSGSDAGDAAQAKAEAAAEPRDIVTLSAGAMPSPAPIASPMAEPVPSPEPVALTTPEAADPAPEPLAQPDLPPPPATIAETTGAAPSCDTTLTALPAANAMIDIVLLAPCAFDATIVVQHAGLAISARTSESGTAFLSLPAMDPAGEVMLRLDDGTELVAEVPTDLTGLRRFAVQWQGDDRFQLHAFENDATYGAAGHIWAETATETGRLLTLGDPSVAMPLMAEVYTFPPDPAQKVRLSVEAEVTGTTCARDILGETLAAEGGQVTVTEVTLAMPGCDAVGDFLVLNNLLPETTLAAAAAD